MNDTIALLFTTFLYALLIAIVIRSLLTWFPGASQNEFGRLLARITEPILGPVRQRMPRTGMIDFSALVVIVVLYLMIQVVNQAAAN